MFKYALFVAESEKSDADIFVGNFGSSEEAWGFFNGMNADHACVVEFMES